MASRRPDPIPPPDPAGGEPDLGELVEHLAVDLAREYVDLHGARSASRRSIPEPPSQED